MRAGGELQPPDTAEWTSCSSSSLPARVPRRPASSRPGSRTPPSPRASTGSPTVAGLDLAHYGTEADADTIRDTEIAQPLLVATGLVAGARAVPAPGRRVRRRSAPSPGTASASSPPPRSPARHRRAGHGPGPRARQGDGRGRRGHPDRHDRRPRRRPRRGARRDREARPDRRPTTTAPARSSPPAPSSSSPRFAEDPPAKARLIPLSVAGAFHTEHMAPAVGRLDGLAASVSHARPAHPR